MGKSKSIKPTIRAQAAALASTGLTQREIARQLHISIHAVNLSIKNLNQERISKTQQEPDDHERQQSVTVGF